MFYSRAAIALLSLILPLTAQEVTRAKDVREIAKGGSASIPRLTELVSHPSAEIRLEAVKQIVEIGRPEGIDALVKAASDNDPDIQIRATDGLVNFYLPGYVKTGIAASIRKVGTGIKGRFTDTNDQVIDGYVQVRPDAIAALGKVARGGSRMDARANAARAIGILRGKAAVPDLLEAMKSKDSDVIFESLVALQKIGDESAGPQIAYLLRDFDQRVQIAAVETTGLLRNKAAVPALEEVLARASQLKVKRTALLAIARLGEPASAATFARYLQDKDERLRGAAAEGYGRLKNPANLAEVQKVYEDEQRISPRLSQAFALVALGRRENTETSPLQYLVNTLNSSSWRGEAFPLLVELARDPQLRAVLYPKMTAGTKEEKAWLCRVMARSGGPDSVDALQKLQGDPDPDVAQEAIRALRTVRSRS